MSVNFHDFLKQIDPQQSYQIAKLTGGIVNVTARATKASQDAIHLGKFPGHGSIVLKYAPPFVAGVGPEAILTQTRQVTEATILSFFGRPLGHIRRHANVAVPTLLHHDSKRHIIVMSDLGHIPNLSETFSVLGGYTPDEAAEAITKVAERHEQGEFRLYRPYYNALGTRLGTFFAHLHSQETLRKVSTLAEATGVQLLNPELLLSVHEFAIKPIKTRLALFVDLIPASESVSTLYEKIEDDWLRSTCDDEQSFILGDCWTGAILVSPLVHSNGSFDISNPHVGVIDWEFATIARAPHGDIPQLLAHLELFRQAAFWCNSTYHIHALNAIISSLISAYKAISTDRDEAWVRSNAKKDVEHSKSLPRPSSLIARIIRSALLAFALEMFNCAFWKVWPCLEPSCPALVSHRSILESTKPGSFKSEVQDPTTERGPSFQTYNTSPSIRGKVADIQDMKEEPRSDAPGSIHDEARLHMCPLVRSMARSAIWLMCHAGKSEVDMCQDLNWEELLDGLPVISNHQSRTYHATSNNHLHQGDHNRERQPGGNTRHITSSSLSCDESMGGRLWLLDSFT